MQSKTVKSSNYESRYSDKSRHYAKILDDTEIEISIVEFMMDFVLTKAYHNYKISLAYIALKDFLVLKAIRTFTIEASS